MKIPDVDKKKSRHLLPTLQSVSATTSHRPGTEYFAYLENKFCLFWPFSQETFDLGSLIKKGLSNFHYHIEKPFTSRDWDDKEEVC